MLHARKHINFREHRPSLCPAGFFIFVFPTSCISSFPLCHCNNTKLLFLRYTLNAGVKPCSWPKIKFLFRKVFICFLFVRLVCFLVPLNSRLINLLLKESHWICFVQIIQHKNHWTNIAYRSEAHLCCS